MTTATIAAAHQRSAELEELIGADAHPFRILTGDRPAGYLHLGHYFATLRNRVRLQDAGAEVAADILFCKANLVPVGQDQLPHVELTRLIARRFNERYGRVFPEPDALLSAAPLLLGTDGQKMSKSRGNAITLRASADETAWLIRGAKTDPERRISYDPVNRPEVSSLVLLAALCLDRDPASVANDIGNGGAAVLKAVVTEAVNERFAGIRARRAELAADMAYVRRALRDGCELAGAIADATLAEVRAVMGMSY